MRRIGQDAMSVGFWAKTTNMAQYNNKETEEFHSST